MADFPETRWSVIARAAADPDSNERRKALEAFCQAYWVPLYGFARGTGKSQSDAEDAVQGFALTIIQNPKKFEKLDSEKGKLRDWLRTAFRHFMITEWKKEQALKRGGGVEFLEFDVEGGEQRIEESLKRHMDPEKAFDQQWARTVLSRARRRLREAHAEAGKADEFDVLRPFLDAGAEVSAQEAADKLGKSVDAVRMTVSRLRKDFRESVRWEIADTMGTSADVEEELRYLLECL